MGGLAGSAPAASHTGRRRSSLQRQLYDLLRWALKKPMHTMQFIKIRVVSQNPYRKWGERMQQLIAFETLPRRSAERRQTSHASATKRVDRYGRPPRRRRPAGQAGEPEHPHHVGGAAPPGSRLMSAVHGLPVTSPEYSPGLRRPRRRRPPAAGGHVGHVLVGQKIHPRVHSLLLWAKFVDEKEMG